MLFPNKPLTRQQIADPDLSTVKYEGEKQARYAEYVRERWLEHQREANRQASEITLRLVRKAGLPTR